MQEQPPSDPPRREPATSARRSRSTQPTFTPPPTPVPPADQAGSDGGPAPRQRRAKVPPTVLFQPPEPAQAAQPAGGPGRTLGGAAPGTAPRPRPTDEETSNAPAGDDTAPAARKATRGRRAAAPAEDGSDTGAETVKPTKRTKVKKATPAAKKATPTARKRAGRPAAESADRDEEHIASPAADLATSGTSARSVEATPPGTETASRTRPDGTETAGHAPTAETETASDTIRPQGGSTAEAGQVPPSGDSAVPPAPQAGAGGTAGDGSAEPTGPVSTAGVAAAPETAPPATTRARKAPTKKATSAKRTPAQKATAARKAAPTPAETRDGPEQPVKAEPATIRVDQRSVAIGPEPGHAVTVEPAQPAAGSQEVASGRTPGEGWRAVGARVVEHPGFAPELLALAAVEELGPRARDWVERTRSAYPDAGADGLARLATRRFVRLAGTGGALAAGAGLLAPVAELAAVLWTQANLVLHLAAVYGRDPGHSDRVAELLVLTQVHPDIATARAALDAVRSAGPPVDGPWPRAAEAAWRLATPLAAQAGGWLGLRLASRLLPGAAVLTAAAGDSAAAERLAARAAARYRPVRTR
ncbi:hypothetical protein ACGFI9_19420 [Micromonospora sp. NPDC048930]|uniref:hypothetical protein n=1 Tax=Micromonospora sp. NPDC048930 TaxID=3364261 RepID=UPI00371A836B